MTSILAVPQHEEPSAACCPLVPNLDDFDSWLAGQGYTPSTRRTKLRLVKAFHLWLDERQLDVTDAAQIDAWLGGRGERSPGMPATGRQSLAWLRAIQYLAPEEADQESNVPPVAKIESRHESFLRDDKGLSPVTVKDRLWVAHDFLGDRFPTRTLDLGALTLDDVNGYIRRSCKKWSAPGGRRSWSAPCEAFSVTSTCAATSPQISLAPYRGFRTGASPAFRKPLHRTRSMRSWRVATAVPPPGGATTPSCCSWLAWAL